MEDSFEIVVAGPRDSRVLLTCEHASARAPAPYGWHPEDEWLRETHWSHDIGAADLTRELAAAWQATAVLSRFTRLLADPNRPEGHPELFRPRAEGRPVRMNQGLSTEEEESRLAGLYRAYHGAVDAQVGAHAAEILFSVHSFTDLYEGVARQLEVGVLFTTEAELAGRVADSIAQAGMRVALNEPYSGKDGLMYSVDHHARTHQRRAIEIEVRQDLIVDGKFRRSLAEALANGLFQG